MRYIAHKWLLFQESFSCKNHRLSCVKLGTFHSWKCNKEGCVSSFNSAWKGLNELTLTKRCLMLSWFSADAAFLFHVFLFPPSFLLLSLFLLSYFLIYVPHFLPSVLFFLFVPCICFKFLLHFFRLHCLTLSVVLVIFRPLPTACLKRLTSLLTTQTAEKQLAITLCFTNVIWIK
jgi:hypothetical protein